MLRAPNTLKMHGNIERIGRWDMGTHPYCTWYAERPYLWTVPVEQRLMDWRPADPEECNPQYRPPVALALVMRYYEMKLLWLDKELKNTKAGNDLGHNGIHTRRVIMAQVKVAQALMQSWPTLPEMISLPVEAEYRADILTDEVYQAVKNCYNLEPIDYWLQWIWPDWMRALYPDETSEAAKFDIAAPIHNRSPRTNSLLTRTLLS